MMMSRAEVKNDACNSSGGKGSGNAIARLINSDKLHRVVPARGSCMLCTARARRCIRCYACGQVIDHLADMARAFFSLM